MKQICQESGEEFSVSQQDLQFYNEISPEFGGTKIFVPAPKLSPAMRQRRRMAFRNERSLHHRTCSLSGKKIVSIFPEDSIYKVLDQDVWWSDRWDPFEYGRDFDFSKTFAEQYSQLSADVPHMSLFTRNVENSYYTNYAVNLKNCYLLYGIVESEDCAYGRSIYDCRDVYDGLNNVRCELCYQGVSSDGCYGCLYFTNCRDCSECMFVEDCQSCKNCILCFGLHQKEYCVGNEFVGKERYEEIRKSFLPLTAVGIKAHEEELRKLKAKLPHRQSHNFKCEDCIGDGIYNSKNCEFCFHVTECEDSRYLYACSNGVCSYDVTYAAPYGPEFAYEMCSATGTKQSIGIFLCWLCESAYYSMECQSSRDIFGCLGLRNQQYCIFNKQYSKEDYATLAAKIAMHMTETGEWGEFFPVSLSPFGYNETVASEEFPLSKNEVLELGWNWRDMPEMAPADAKQASDFPAVIDEVPDSIVDETLRCSATGKPYKIIKQEFNHYQKLGIPIPHVSPNERHRQRLQRRAPLHVWPRECAKTGKAIWSTFAPARPEIVYSDEAYFEEVI